MKADLRLLPNPSLHWQAIALMLQRRDDFPKDVTMVVEPNRLRFLDSQDRELRNVPWMDCGKPSLDSAISLLDLIEDEFPQAVG